MEVKNRRMIALEGSFNFRDLGGYKTKSGNQVKWGKLFRSGNLSKLTNKDIDLVNQLGISRILDLRSLEEISLHPNPEIEGVKGVHIQVIPSESLSKEQNSSAQAAIHTDQKDMYKQLISGSSSDQIMIELYEQMVSFGDAYKQVFKELLEQPNEPILFHCMAGKDRTGITGALILSALGVSRETIVEDYTLTNQSVDKIKVALLGDENNGSLMNISSDSIQAFLEARPEYLETFFTGVDKKFGSIDNYLSKAIGLTEGDKEVLYNNFLEAI